VESTREAVCGINEILLKGGAGVSRCGPMCDSMRPHDPHAHAAPNPKRPQTASCGPMRPHAPGVSARAPSPGRARGPGLIRFAIITHYTPALPRITTHYHPLPRITHPLPTDHHPLPQHYHPLPRCYPRIAHPPEGVFFGWRRGGAAARRGSILF
jgi:hypothetical protein